MYIHAYLSSGLLTHRIDGWHNRLWLTLINQRTHNAANTIMRARPKNTPSGATWRQNGFNQHPRASALSSFRLAFYRRRCKWAFLRPMPPPLPHCPDSFTETCTCSASASCECPPRLNYVTPSWPHVTLGGLLARRSANVCMQRVRSRRGLTHSCLKFSKTPCRIKIYCSDDLMCTDRGAKLS